MGPAIKFRDGLLLAAIWLAGCDKTPPEQGQIEASVNVASEVASNMREPLQPATSRIVPADQETIDPKGPAAARELVVGYFRHLQEGKNVEARRFWTEGADAKALEAKLAEVNRLQVQVGKPGEPEGAAGSIYIEVPVQLAGQSPNGTSFELAGSVALRRVNNVPGSSESQRRWHIFRADLQPRP